MIDGKNFFDQPKKNNKVTYEEAKETVLVFSQGTVKVLSIFYRIMFSVI